MFQGYLLEFCWGIIFQVGNTIKLMLFKGNICSGFRSNGCWLRSNLSFLEFVLNCHPQRFTQLIRCFAHLGCCFLEQTAAYFVQFVQVSSGLVGSSSHAVSICASCTPIPGCKSEICEDDALLLFGFFGVFFFFTDSNPMANTSPLFTHHHLGE